MSDVRNSKDGLSRRQFLSYALGGTGAFMTAAIVAPLVPFAVDPLTKAGAKNFVEVGNEADFSTTLPKRVEFTVHKKDGWYESDAKLSAWIIKKEDGSWLAMSPICTHLGCQVNGSTDAAGNPTPPQDGEWFFHCPCHGSFFNKYGVPKPNVPATRPLDAYAVQVENGKVKLGPISQRKA
ncbi:ubiquinol-cytochrome c reductase iron-sulfur subunit [Effusibacillus dendaii]|uniref:Menaquinol-cytochrome C reductase iron-sulfur subunit n=1 Tax=Effusibacillus dendaii TaxID=2743772 RepID=A0A7I8DBW5_9BACL|nr:ubiquinol-cytochrome c reductase iron-sulfur subunit [Effusibacillus dendaii]BCJ85411.1 menaquinol-cytochrome C reductase iron-sulfur subunit [Effusibacillus dendaii]